LWSGLLALCVLLSVIVLPDGVSRSYDWGLHAAWIERFHQQLVAGEWWPQWLADADGGRGAPVFVFYPPLAYWLAAAFRAACGDAVLALELSEAFAVVLLYLSAHRLFLPGNRPLHAAALALACSLSPALLFIAFRVHMLGATLALAAFPCLLHALRAPRRTPLSRILELALALAFIGWTHLASLLLAAALLGGHATLQAITAPASTRRVLGITLVGAALGLGMAAAPLWPALAEQDAISTNLLRIGNLDWRSNFLFDPSALRGGFRADYAFLAVGAAILILLASLAWWASRAGVADSRQPTVVAALLSLLSVALATPLAWPAYALAWPLQMLQFPWRWLPLASVCALLAVASWLPASRRPWVWIAAALLPSLTGLMMLAADGGALLPQRSRTTAAQEQWTVANMPRVAPEYRPRALAEALDAAELTEPVAPASSDSALLAIESLPGSAMLRRWQLSAPEPTTITLGVACFPGWTAYLDQREVLPLCGARGLLQVRIPAGVQQLDLRFEPTPARRWARAASASSASLWLLLWLRLIWPVGGRLRRSG
jgi:hypothetical protein